MFKFINPFKTPKNVQETDGIIAKNVKKLILSFVRRFYNPNLQYADSIINEWINGLVKFFIDIFVNGFMLYICFFSFLWIFPKLNNYINIGTEFWHFPITLVSFGLVSWLVVSTYHYFKIGYKMG